MIFGFVVWKSYTKIIVHGLACNIVFEFIWVGISNASDLFIEEALVTAFSGQLESIEWTISQSMSDAIFRILNNFKSLQYLSKRNMNMVVKKKHASWCYICFGIIIPLVLNITLLAKRLLHPNWRQYNQCGSNFCVSTWLKLAWYGPVIVTQRNPTLPWADIQCKVKWDRRAPKPQYRWSFPQTNLHTVITLNQYLHIFSKVFFWLFEQCPVQPYGY